MIDECHKSIPRIGTPKEVEEWFAEHRHEKADVLLITQSYGKLNRAIVEAVQMVYRVKKAIMLGSSTSYVRKVQDGVRGEVVNTGIRKYDSRHFPLYSSYTKSNTAGQEAYANDIVPLWRRWPIIGFGGMLVILSVMLASGVSLNPMSPNSAKTKSSKAPFPVEVASGVPAVRRSPAMFAVPEKQDKDEPSMVTTVAPPHPLHPKTLHLVGFVEIPGQEPKTVFSVAQGGLEVMQLRGVDLVKMGYSIKVITRCVTEVAYAANKPWLVLCDRAQVEDSKIQGQQPQAVAPSTPSP